jgi:hypothetical protein
VLKIQRSSNGQVTYMLSGQIEEEDIDELEAIVRSEAKGHHIVFDRTYRLWVKMQSPFSIAVKRTA